MPVRLGAQMRSTGPATASSSAAAASGSSTQSILRQHHDLRPFRNVLGVGAELVVQLTVALCGALFCIGGHQVDVDRAALDVLEELMSEPRAIAGALDESGDVRHHERGVPAEPHDAQVGDQCREGVVGDARSGGADGGDEGALAGIGEAEQTDIGEQLQLETHPHLDAGLAGRGVARGPTRGALEVGVAESALAAVELPLGAFLVEVDQPLVGLEVVDHRSDGDLDDQVFAGAPAHPASHPVATTLGDVPLVASQVDEGVLASVGAEDDVPSTSAIAAIGSPTRSVGLTSEGDGAVTAVAGGDDDSDFRR